MNIMGGQIRGALFNIFVVKKCPFLQLPDVALSFLYNPWLPPLPKLWILISPPKLPLTSIPKSLGLPYHGGEDDWQYYLEYTFFQNSA